MLNELEQPLSGGNLASVVRKGNTVRRSTGPWSPAVHALLKYLEAAGYEAAPRFLGIDESGREMISFIPGETIPDELEGYEQDEVLTVTAQLLRRYHDTVAGFSPPPEANWYFIVGAPRSGEVICHNDIAPYNTIAREGRPVAFIDWDMAAPAPRTWDIAYALWRYAPLYEDERFGGPPRQARRMALFCDGYGLSHRAGLVDTILSRQAALYETLKTWAAQGVPAFARMWEEGHGLGIARDMAYLRRHRDEFTRALESTHHHLGGDSHGNAR